MFEVQVVAREAVNDLRVRWSLSVPGIAEPVPINDGQEYRVADGRAAFRFNNAIPAGFALPETGALGVTVLAHAGGLPRISVLEPNGAAVRSSNLVFGTVFLDVRSSPFDGSCWFLTNQAIGRVEATSGAVTAQTALPTSLETVMAPTAEGGVLFLDPSGDSAILHLRPTGIAGCVAPVCVDPFVDFNGQTYRNARSIAVDPVRGTVWVTVGPEPGDDSPAALLQLSPEGERLGLVPAADPGFITVNR